MMRAVVMALTALACNILIDMIRYMINKED